jgi:hypothetical protein
VAAHSSRSLPGPSVRFWRNAAAPWAPGSAAIAGSSSADTSTVIGASSIWATSRAVATAKAEHDQATRRPARPAATAAVAENEADVDLGVVDAGELAGEDLDQDDERADCAD